MCKATQKFGFIHCNVVLYSSSIKLAVTAPQREYHSSFGQDRLST